MIDLKDSTSFSIPRTPKEHHMSTNLPVKNITGEDFAKVIDAVNLVAYDCGDQDPIDTLEFMVDTLTEMRARACS